jgi:hypothetical protein
VENGSHNFIGEAKFTISEIFNKGLSTVLTLTKKGRGNVGELEISNAILEERPHFL